VKISWALRKTLLFGSIILYFSVSSCYAQLQPAFRIIDKNFGLQSNTIYNIHAAKNGLLYIAHSKGLSSFDGNAVKNYYNKSFPYTELTNIVETDDGAIYAKAFNNVLYKINGDSTEMVAYYANNYGFTPGGCYKNVIISVSNDTVIFYNTVSKKTEKKILGDIPITEQPNDFIFTTYAVQNLEEVIIFIDKSFKISRSPLLDIYGGSLHCSGGNAFVVKNKSVENIRYLKDHELLSIKARNTSTNVNYITVVDSLCWICTTNGLYFYDAQKGISTLHYILAGYNITDVDQTFEGNFFASTLDRGLVLIPSFDVNFLPALPNNIGRICATDKGILVGTKTGELFDYNTKANARQQVIKNKIAQPFTYILTDSFNKQIIYCDYLNLTIGKTIASNKAIKDHCYVQNDLLLATNSGFCLLANRPITSWLKNYINKEIPSKGLLHTLLFNNDEFVATVKYDAVHEKLYLNTYDGIFEMANGYSKPKKLPEPGCVLKDMTCYKGLLYLASKDKGILVWDGKTYKPLAKNNPSKDILLKFELYKDELWVLGEHAMYCYKGDSFFVYDNRFGIDVQSTLNFCVNETEVFLNNGLDILSFPKDIANTNIPRPIFRINKLYTEQKNTALKQNIELADNDNTVRIDFSLIAFANSGNTHLAYNINGGKTYHLGNSVRNIELNNLMPDDYAIKFFLVVNNKIENKFLEEIKFSIKPPFYKTIQFTIAMVLLTILLGLTIARYILNNWKKQALQKEAKILLEKELDKSMLTSIKAQMNPHFLFNALNTIQSYIYSNDKLNAGKYISVFSRLTRSILDMSNKETISLAEEIESLKLYLELEKMRFEDTLNYDFIIDEHLDRESITLPSMLLQPYVENAIKHGLLHKKTNRLVVISVAEKNKLLEITIDDNGIGRKRSNELNAIKNRNHTSFASSANQKRLEILQNNFKHIHFEIIDKLTEFGEACGTKVVIKLNL
jgi:Histidine kinase